MAKREEGIIEFTPMGGLNQDDSLITPSENLAGHNSFEAGDYAYAYTLRIGSSRAFNDGSGENFLGTVAISGYYIKNNTGWVAGSPPTGRNIQRGKYENKELNKIYYCYYNSSDNHYITYYDPIQNVTYELLRWSGLKFNEKAFIKMAMIDNYLSITDRINRPRLIDVTKINDLFILLGNNLREFHISFHKWAPVAPPVPRVYFQSFPLPIVNNYEKLKNRIFHFSYRWVYVGDFKSRWSPISKGFNTSFCGQNYDPLGKKISSIQVDIPGCILDHPGANVEYNYFGHTDIKFTSVVKYIEIAYRDGELELWKLWKRVSTVGFSRYQLFDGNVDGTPLDEDEFLQDFDVVPFLAGTVEAIDNRFIFGDTLEELSPLDNKLVTDSGTVSIANSESKWRDSLPDSFSQLPSDAKDNLIRINSGSDFTFKDRGFYKVAFQFIAENGWRSAAYAGDVSNVTSIINSGKSLIFNINSLVSVPSNQEFAFNFKISDSFVIPEWAVAMQMLRTNVLNIDYFMYGNVNKFVPLINVPDLSDIEGLPQTLKDKFAEHFENSKNVNGYEFAKLFEDVEKIGAAKKKSAFKKNPLKAKKRIEAYGAYLGSNPVFPRLMSELRKTTEDVIGNSSRIFIDINNWYNAPKDTNTKDRQTVNKLYYNFRDGDRVRFIGSTESATPSDSQKKVFDVEIIEFTGRGIIIDKPEGLLWLPPAASNSADFYIEVYTPRTPNEDNHIFYEMGEWYPILKPGTENRSLSKKDFVYTSNADITSSEIGPFFIYHKMPLFYGDCSVIRKAVFRDSNAGQSGYEGTVTTSMNPDPDRTFDNWDNNNGRSSIAYRDLPVVRQMTTQMRFGGKILEGSFVNNLTRFQPEDYFTYPSEYGRIRNIINTANAQVESSGSILLVIGEREVFSVYVNRTTLQDLSGRNQISLSDKVLGSYNTLLGSYGTFNPESVSIEAGNVYWWSGFRSVWCRYGRDGVTPISKYKMRSWFKELGRKLIPYYNTDNSPLVLSEFDPYTEELVTYIDHSSLPATFRGYAKYKGCVFSENDNRWKHFHPYTPDMMSKINDIIISAKGGNLFIHEQDTVNVNRIYGVKVDSYIEPVFNKNPKDIKSWQSISITSTDKWMVERFSSEYRGNKVIQESSIEFSNFEEKEDSYYASIKRDKNTKNVESAEVGLIEGDQMRSKALKALLKLDPDVGKLSLLHYVTVTYIDSPKNI